MITRGTGGAQALFILFLTLLLGERTLAADAIRSHYLRIELPGDERVLSDSVAGGAGSVRAGGNGRRAVDAQFFGA